MINQTSCIFHSRVRSKHVHNATRWRRRATSGGYIFESQGTVRKCCEVAPCVDVHAWCCALWTNAVIIQLLSLDHWSCLCYRERKQEDKKPDKNHVTMFNQSVSWKRRVQYRKVFVIPLLYLALPASTLLSTSGRVRSLEADTIDFTLGRIQNITEHSISGHVLLAFFPFLAQVVVIRHKLLITRNKLLIICKLLDITGANHICLSDMSFLNNEVDMWNILKHIALRYLCRLLIACTPASIIFCRQLSTSGKLLDVWRWLNNFRRW